MLSNITCEKGHAFMNVDMGIVDPCIRAQIGWCVFPIDEAKTECKARIVWINPIRLDKSSRV